MLKVNPTTGAWAPYGYVWEYNATLGQWILQDDPDVQV